MLRLLHLLGMLGLPLFVLCMLPLLAMLTWMPQLRGGPWTAWVCEGAVHSPVRRRGCAWLLCCRGSLTLQQTHEDVCCQTAASCLVFRTCFTQSLIETACLGGDMHAAWVISEVACLMWRCSS